MHPILQIQAVVDDLQESACKRTEDVHHELSDMQNLTADAEKNWNNFLDGSEKNNAEDSASLEFEKCTLEQGLQFWYVPHNHSPRFSLEKSCIVVFHLILTFIYVA